VTSPTAVITGASRGVGRELALELSARGMELLLLMRASEAQRTTEELLRREGRSFHTLLCDLRERDQVDRASKELLAKFGPPQLVVHNAAIVRRASLAQTKDEDWDEQMEVNVTAPFRLTRSLLPEMLKTGQGRIVFISSISAVVGTARQAGYNASKAALVALMRCLAEELSGTPLMTTALLPGSVDTEMLKGSGFSPSMTAADVARSVAYYGLEAPKAHNGAVIEMFGV
jgi:3-oxoacyl-[acyl-carrier protein] reductase